MDKIDIILKTCDFYKKECKKVLAESIKCKTVKEKKDNLVKLKTLKAKIIFEIEQINKIIKESQDGDEWKDG